MRLVVITVVLFVAGVPVGQARLPQTDEPVKIFVLAGQSNMAGYGQPVPVEAPRGNVYDLTHGAAPAIDPLGDAPGVGPGRFAALALARRGVQVGLVNCAVGGTSLDQWLPAGIATVYPRCLTLVREAQRYGVLAGVFFMQGETDGMRPEWASTWAPRFSQFVTNIRRDLNAPGLPVVFGRTRDFTSCLVCGLPFSTTVREQQAAVRLPGVAMVDSDGLALDGEHFTVPGYAALGARFAWAWLTMPSSATGRG